VELKVEFCRPDDKTARDNNIVAGAVLHLVLALRGGTL
jgi:ubiquitin-like protein Nedd8